MNYKVRASLLIVSLGLMVCPSFSVSAAESEWGTKSYSEQYDELIAAVNEGDSKLGELASEQENYQELSIQAEAELARLEQLYETRVASVQHVGSKRSDLQQLELILSAKNIGQLTRKAQTEKTRAVGTDEGIKGLEQQVKYQSTRLSQLKQKEQLAAVKLEGLAVTQETKVAELEQLEALMEKKPGALQFDAQNLLTKSNAGVEEMERALRGTALAELADVYVEAENRFGLNAFFLAALSAQESAWGTSKRAQEDNNLTGFGVYDDDAEGLNAQTKRDNLLETASWIKKGYLTPSGPYFNGYSIRNVNTRYCIGYDGKTDYHWSENISKIAMELVSKAG